MVGSGPPCSKAEPARAAGAGREGRYARPAARHGAVARWARQPQRAWSRCTRRWPAGLSPLLSREEARTPCPRAKGLAHRCGTSVAPAHQPSSNRSGKREREASEARADAWATVRHCRTVAQASARAGARTHCHSAKRALTPRAQLGRARHERGAARYRPPTTALGSEQGGQRTQSLAGSAGRGRACLGKARQLCPRAGSLALRKKRVRARSLGGGGNATPLNHP